MLPRRRSVEFPCCIKTMHKGEKRWCFFDSDGLIAKVPTRFANHLQDMVPHGIAESSVETYLSDLKTTLSWMRDVIPVNEPISFDKMILLVGREHVERTLKSMIESGVSQSTVVRREIVLQKLFVYCSTQKSGPVRTDHPYSEVPSLTSRTGVSVGSQRDIDEFVNYEMVGNILCNLHNECERTLFHFMFDTGTRISETIEMRARQLPKLTVEQRRAATLDDYYNLPSRDLYLSTKIFARKKRSTTPPSRQVVVSLPTIKRIQNYHRTIGYLKGIQSLGYRITDPDRPVFLSSNGQVWSRRNALKQFRAACERIGLGEWVVVHGLRAGAAYLILVSEDMGKTFADRLREAKKQLGHRLMATLEKYYTKLPAPLLARFQNKAKDNLKWKYLYDLNEETWLSPKKHTENRGKRKR